MPQFDPRLDGLFDLAVRDGVDIRPSLLRVLTDLYVQKPFHTREEETQYVELATGLIDAVDDATRMSVAARLHSYRAAPAAVLQKLSAVETSQPSSGDPIELFFSASSEERRLILTNMVVSGQTRFVPASADRLARLEAAAMQRNPAEFARLMRAPLAIAPALADRIVQDASGEALVVAAKALGMSAAVLQRVLLFLNPAIGHSVARVYELADLFDALSPQAAAYMLALWRETMATPFAPDERTHKRVYEPATANDEPRSARSFADHAARPVTRMPRTETTLDRKRDQR
jgi:uncharacterized protein (DUF2336 family)